MAINPAVSMQMQAAKMATATPGMLSLRCPLQRCSARYAVVCVRASASDDRNGNAAKQSSQQPAQRGGRGFTRPDDAPTRLERVERLGEEVWSRSGIAGVDRGGDGTSLGRAALLAGGDAAAVLLFAGIGRGSHAELDGLAGVLNTAWPFLAGWYTAAYVTGAYGAAAQGRSVRGAAGAAAKAWALGIPLALALRSASKGAPPPVPFVIVASVATAVLLIGWRSALAAAMPKAEAKAGNRSGGPLEFLSLLGGLTKRW